MKEKTLKKKLFTMFLISIMVIGMLLPYMAGSEKTYAATSRNIKQNGLIGTANYQTQGKIYKDPEGFNWRQQYGGITTFSDSAGERNLFCVNPLLFAPDSTRSLYDMLSFYPKMTQTKLNYIASGVDYLLNRYPKGNTGEKQVLAQMFIWKEMSGIGEYEISSLSLTGTGSNLYNDGMAKARSWASANQNKAVGRGIIYASSDKMQQTVAKFYVSYQGKLNLKKVVGSHSDLVSKFPDKYSLKGAVYTVYRDSGLTSSVGTLTTDANGNTNTLEVQQGTYYIKETKAPKGFKLDPKVYTVNVTSGKTSTLNTKDEPEIAYAKLKKETLSDKKLTDLCPEQYSLEGAKYGVYSDSGLSKQVGTLVTDKDGNTGSLTLAPGTYYVKELESPKGYALDKNTYTLSLSNGKTSLLKVSDRPLFDPLSLKIEKKAAKGSDKNLSLEGAEYTVKYYKEYLNKDQVNTATPFRTWVFKTDENGRIRVDDMWRVAGDALFKNEAGIPVGLLGTYVFEETKAPKGFAKTDGIIAVQQVKKDEKLDQTVVLKDVTDVENPQTVSISLQKIDAETGKPVPQGFGSFEGAVYEVFYYDSLTSEDVSVGEIKTDNEGKGSLTGLKPGLYTVKEKVPPKGYLVNDEEIEVQARIKEINTANFNYEIESKELPTTTEISKIDLSDNSEVLGSELELQDKNGKVIDSWVSDGKSHVVKGLTVGETYILREKKAPEGYFLNEEPVEFTVKDTGNIQKVDFKNEPIPEIKTKAFTSEGIDESLPEGKVTIVDRVSYDKLIPGKEYTIKGKLVNQKDENEVLAEGETTFTPEEPKGEIKVEFTLNAADLEGESVVVFEDLYKEGKKLTSHAEITDKDQTIDFPKVRTKAGDKVDGGNEINGDKDQTIVDTVSYSNLKPGKEYTVKGYLINKETGEPILIGGEKVSSEKVFTPEEESGTVSIEFTFDASSLKGETIVVFEDLYRKDIKVGSHADIEDRDQTIYVPKIGTLLNSKDDGGKAVLLLKEVSLIDKVSYENLDIGKSYLLKGKLIRKSDKAVLAEGEKAFAPEERKGACEVDFTFDSSTLRGSDVVVFETLYLVDEEGDIIKPVGSHEDIEDKGQTVRVENPEIRTKASNISDRKDIKNFTVRLRDIVEYRNLVPGKEYTLKGKLMDKDTGKVITGKGGKEVRSEIKFTPDKPDGKAEMEFTVDYESVRGKTTVVFEDLYIEDTHLATHADIEDRNQTVKIKSPGSPTFRIEIPNTGDDMPLIVLFFLNAAFLSGCLILKIRRHMKKS